MRGAAWPMASEGEIVTIQFQTIDGTRMMARISMMEATRLTSTLKQVLIDYLARDGHVDERRAC